jgi:hypothetical protein
MVLEWEATIIHVGDLPKSLLKKEKLDLFEIVRHLKIL